MATSHLCYRVPEMNECLGSNPSLPRKRQGRERIIMLPEVSAWPKMFFMPDTADVNNKLSDCISNVKVAGMADGHCADFSTEVPDLQNV
jgi:hypothetical protein